MSTKQTLNAAARCSSNSACSAQPPSVFCSPPAELLLPVATDADDKEAKEATGFSGDDMELPSPQFCEY